MNNDTILKTLKLSSLEFDIYQILSKSSPLSVLQIAQILSTPRTTIHSNVEKLLDKGFVVKVLVKNRWKFTAQSAEIFKEKLNRKQQDLNRIKLDLEHVEKSLPEFLEKMQLTKISHKQASNVSIYEGKKGIKHIYKLALNSTKLRAYPNAYWVIQLVPEITGMFKQKLNSATFECWDIFVKGKAGEETVKELSSSRNYHYKFMPEGFDIKEIDYCVFEDKVAIFTRNPAPQVVLIEDKFLAEQAATLFDLMWKLLL